MNKNLTVKDVLICTNGKLIYGNENLECVNFSIDTRTIQGNDVFIGIKGETFDGNLFYKEAFDKGAKVCIVENNNDEKPIEGKTLILVDNTITALGKIAKFRRDTLDIPVVAITGSVGKTSTRDIITNILSQKYKVLSTSGNFNNNIGLPLTILRYKDEDIMVLEMGMNSLGEISYLSKIASPTLAVITNVGTAHIGKLHGQNNILKAKMEITDGLQKGGVLIINNDNKPLHDYLGNIKCKYMTVGINNKSDIMAENIEYQDFSSTFKVNDRNYKINVGGPGFVYNSLLGYAVGITLGLTEEQIKKGIESVKLTSKRMEKTVTERGVTIINDAYNASYDSVENAITVINYSKNKRKIFVFGDILELEEYSKEIHEEIAELILKSTIDIVITVGTESKYTADKLKSNGFNKVYEFEKESDTYNFIRNLLKEDDLILFKGSNGIKLFNIVEQIK